MSYSGKSKKAQQRLAERAANFKPWQPVEAPPPNPVDEADVAFFRRFPDRTVRMRPASLAEAERQVANHLDLPAMPPGWRWFALAQRDAHGVRHRRFFMAPAGTDFDLSEAETLAKWNEVPPPEDLAAVVAVAAAARCVVFDVAVGEGGDAYPDAKAARQALTAFAAKAGLPDPLVIPSAAGITALWPFPDGLPAISLPAMGLHFATIVKQSARRFGLRVGEVTVCDTATALKAIQEAGR